MSLYQKIPGVRILVRTFEYMNRAAPLKEFADYDEYWKERTSTEPAPRELDRFKTIARLVGRNEKVLDIGCGDGSFQRHLQQVHPSCQSLGVDTSSEAVSVAQKHGCTAQVLDTSKTLRNQIPGDWDVVTLMEVIEHVPDAENLMRQVLEFRPRRIFVTIPNVGCLKHRLRLMFGGRFPITTIVYHMKEHVRFWTAADFEEWAAVFNLEIHSIHGQFSRGDRFVEWATRRYPSLFSPQIIYELRPSTTV